MTDIVQRAISDGGARQLADATESAPRRDTMSPRWLTHLLQWLPGEAGIYRLDKVKNPESVLIACTNRGDK